MSDILFDTNVLLDVATSDAVWMPWSVKQLHAATSAGSACINPIIYAELAPAFATRDALDQWLHPSVLRQLALPYSAGWLAGQAFVQYRRAGGLRLSPLPDFYIGAHAQAEGLTKPALAHFLIEPSASLISASVQCTLPYANRSKNWPGS